MTDQEAFALHITRTCYGNWLPGDRRGYVANTLHPGGGFTPKINTPGVPYTVDDAYTHARARKLQQWPSVGLTAVQAQRIAESLVQSAAKRRWRILRASIMAQPVHVVITDCPDDGPSVRRILKGNSQAALSDLAGSSHRWFTAGGSDRYKHGEKAINAAVDYVARQERILAEVVDMEVRVPDRSAR